MISKQIGLLSLALLFIFICQSCTNRLSVRTEYLNRENLASYAIKTPDPTLTCPSIGQQLIISWSLPKQYLSYEDLHVNLIVRWHTYEEKQLKIPITSARSYYIYSLVDNQYYQSKGITTYRVEIIGNGEVLETWIHPLWKEWLVFDLSHSN